jgi:hypothetical protein
MGILSASALNRHSAFFYFIIGLTAATVVVVGVVFALANC